MKKLLLLLCLAGFSAGAQVSVKSFSLEEALQYARTHAYDVRDKELELQKATQTITETRAQGLPQVSTGFDFQWIPQIPQTPVPADVFGGAPGTFVYFPMGIEYQNVASVLVNERIDPSYFVALRASKLVKENAAINKEKSIQEIETSTAKAYYTALIAAENQEIIEKNLQSLQQNLFEVRQLHENGFVEEQDVDQLELLVNNLQNNLNNSIRQKEISYDLLKYNMGMELNEEIELTDDLETLLVVDPQVLLQQDLQVEEHIDYRYILTQERGAELQVTYDKLAVAPSLNAFLRHSQTNFSNEFQPTFNFDTYWIPSTTIGIGLSWDIFTGGRRWGTLQKSKLDLQRIQVAREMTKNSLKLNYVQSLSNYEFALENYNTQRRNVSISENIRNKTRIKYREGLSSSLDLTQTENQYLEAQSAYIQALLNLLNSKEELDKALGK